MESVTDLGKSWFNWSIYQLCSERERERPVGFALRGYQSMTGDGFSMCSSTSYPPPKMMVSFPPVCT